MDDKRIFFRASECKMVNKHHSGNKGKGRESKWGNIHKTEYDKSTQVQEEPVIGRQRRMEQVSQKLPQIFWNQVYKVSIRMTSVHKMYIDLLCHWVLGDKIAHNLHCWCDMDWPDISVANLRKRVCLLENPLNVSPFLSCWHLCVSQLDTPHVVASLSSTCSYHKQWLQMGRWLQILKPK